MNISNIGEIAALATACCWTVSALVFENTTNKIGSLAVNLIRLLFAFFLIGIYTSITRGIIFPFDATSKNWLWLSISGIIGFVIGDFMLFKSYTFIGARLSMLLMTLVPPITAIIGLIILDETLNTHQIIGMSITIIGIVIVLLTKKSNEKQNNIKIKGILLAFGAAVCQSLGLVISKFGMGNYNAFSATQIRIVSGIIGFFLIILFFRRFSNVYDGFKNKKVMLLLIVGSIFGPFLGVSLSLYAVQHTNSGIASTIMAIVPILMIPVAIFLFKQKVKIIEIIGIFLSVCGVALLFY